MTNLEKFLDNPTDQSAYSKAYNHSIFSLPASPQYCSGEVCLASFLRSIGTGVSEKEVYPVNSLEESPIRKEFDAKNKQFKEAYGFNDDLLTYLRSPFAGQSPKNPSKYLNLYPLIPPFAYVSNSAQFSGNPWNPGEFIKGMIATGSRSYDEALNHWQELYDHLGVTGDDDLFARMLAQIFNADQNSDAKFKWSHREFEKKVFDSYCLQQDLYDRHTFPAKTFCKNIVKITGLKRVTTRRQWVSMFESFLRICMATHLVWICKVNITFWDAVQQALSTKETIQYDKFLEDIFLHFNSISLDVDTGPLLRKVSGDYAVARIGINLLLRYFEERGDSTASSMSDLNTTVKYFNDQLQKCTGEEVTRIKKTILELLDLNPNLPGAKAGFTKNIFEFLRHSLGQKNTNDSRERNFDQGFWAVKKGKYKSSKWVFRLGPVSLITLVALSIENRAGTATDITSFLNKLGIHLNADKLLSYSVGESLVDLGLTNDNPDGEKGIVVLNPFYLS